MKKINNDADYLAAMAKIDSLMSKGSGNVCQEELEELKALALAAQQYEHIKYNIRTT